MRRSGEARSPCQQEDAVDWSVSTANSCTLLQDNAVTTEMSMMLLDEVEMEDCLIKVWCCWRRRREDGGMGSFP